MIRTNSNSIQTFNVYDDELANEKHNNFELFLHVDIIVYPQILKEHILKNLYLRIWHSSRIMENNGKSEQNLDVFKEDHHDE